MSTPYISGLAAAAAAAAAAVASSSSCVSVSPISSKHVFSRAQTALLEMHFELEPYPSKETRAKLASTMGVREYQVANWFQNSRSRRKQKGEQF
jgi:hypothetical protein